MNISIKAKLDRGYYVPNLPYPVGKTPEAIKAREEYRIQENALYYEFKKDILAALGLSDHPKANDLFDFAWSEGHANGYDEVWHWASRLANLVR